MSVVYSEHEVVQRRAMMLGMRTIKIKKFKVKVPALAVSIPRGGTLRAATVWANIGDIAYAFDLLSLIGNYDPATRDFTVEYGWVLLDQSLAAGARVTTNIDGIVPSWAKGGLRDGVVLVCDYDPATGAITKIYDAYLTEDAISVTGVGAAVESVVYSVV